MDEAVFNTHVKPWSVVQNEHPLINFNLSYTKNNIIISYHIFNNFTFRYFNALFIPVLIKSTFLFLHVKQFGLYKLLGPKGPLTWSHICKSFDDLFISKLTIYNILNYNLKFSDISI